MSNDANKYKVLKQAAERATQKQPDEIHLIAAPNHGWTNAAGIETYAKGIQALRFTDAGTFTVDILPVALWFHLKESDRMYSVIYEHAKAGIWFNFVVLFQDGTSITFTSTPDRGMKHRPGHPVIHAPGAGPADLYSLAEAKCPPQPRKPITLDSLVPEFEKAWADGIQWRKSTGGISAAEVASVVLSREGQTSRVFRAKQVHYVAEQNGQPEAVLKTALNRIFESDGGITKAYLVAVKYDESPEIRVALSIISASPKMKLFDEVRSTFKSIFGPGDQIDIMFVTAAEVARIEAVCRPFFTCGS